MIDVSVVIPTRDRPELLALTLRSVLWQQEVELEVLVVDDGAEPGTQALLERPSGCARSTDAQHGPTGVSGARNSGIAAARGNWIAFLDDDDLWAPDKLSAQLAAANRRARRLGVRRRRHRRRSAARARRITAAAAGSGRRRPAVAQCRTRRSIQRRGAPRRPGRRPAGSTRRSARARIGISGFAWRRPACPPACHGRSSRCGRTPAWRRATSIGCWPTSRSSPHAMAFASTEPGISGGRHGCAWRTDTVERRCVTTSGRPLLETSCRSAARRWVWSIRKWHSAGPWPSTTGPREAQTWLDELHRGRLLAISAASRTGSRAIESGAVTGRQAAA